MDRLSRFVPWIGVLCVLGLVSPAWGAQKTPDKSAKAPAKAATEEEQESIAVSGQAPRADVQATGVQDQLRAAVADSKKRLGELASWQDAAFDEEVLPQYTRFIKDYRQSAQGLQAEVDLEGIRKYLGFHGAKTFLLDNPKAVVHVRPEKDCERCNVAANAIRKILKSRLERRGITVIWPTNAEMGEEPLTGKALMDRVNEVAARKNPSAVIVTELKQKPAEQDDTAHGDDKQFLVFFSLVGHQGSPEQPGKDLKSVGQLEILENDKLEVAAEKLLSDAFSELGSLGGMVAGKPAQERSRDEVLIVVSGIRDFGQLSEVKGKLQGALKDVSPIEERQVTRGQVSFGVRTQKSSEEVTQIIRGLASDGGPISVIGVEEKAVKLEAK